MERKIDRLFAHYIKRALFLARKDMLDFYRSSLTGRDPEDSFYFRKLVAIVQNLEAVRQDRELLMAPYYHPDEPKDFQEIYYFTEKEYDLFKADFEKLIPPKK